MATVPTGFPGQPRALEAGRRLFQGVRVRRRRRRSRPTAAGGAARVAFAGRSNVGKSRPDQRADRAQSARASRARRGAQQINMFDLGGRLMLVDLPGYGFAQAPKAKVDAWQRLIRSYPRARRPDAHLPPGRRAARAEAGRSRVHGDAGRGGGGLSAGPDQATWCAPARSRPDREPAGGSRRPGAHPEIIATSAREAPASAPARGARGAGHPASEESVTDQHYHAVAATLVEALPYMRASPAAPS